MLMSLHLRNKSYTCVNNFVHYKTNIMTKNFFKMQLPFIIVAGALTITLVAWKEDKFAQVKQGVTDTLPKKSVKKVKNLDEALEELNKAQVELEQSIKEIPTPPIDVEKMQAEIERSIKQ